MNQDYFSLLTEQGQARIINAQALGKTVKLTTLKVGDGGEDGGKVTDPKENDTSLVREKWEGPINSIFQHPENHNWLVAETVISEEDGNFYITEFGLYDEDDNLIIVGKYPKTYKPTLAQGSGSSLYVRVILELSNTSTVELKIDPAIVLASRQYVDDKWKTHLEADHPHPQYVKQAVYDKEKLYTGKPGEIGSIRHGLVQGVIVQTSVHSPTSGPYSNGDFPTTDLETDVNVTCHFVTPFNINKPIDSMFWFHAKGYSFGGGKEIDAMFVGYCYGSANKLINVNKKGNFSPNIYTDRHGNVILALTFNNIIYTTITIDSMRVGNAIELNKGDITCILSLETTITYEPTAP
ncbi:phage tail protein [Spartinivicinus poritis]|uniref:Phage tail protein n=1 Tax=Spartinivicinus poritis TaxID=2994640 RepID=A0ABT5UEH7_9GAMM|nr:phage tail protein [Spartinivicinus sp. A2-2]MDE1464785.1 phage tail protein [Spartinivicinus sp. A2-2]